MKRSGRNLISLVSEQCRLPSSPIRPGTTHDQTGPLVLVCLPLSLHPLHLLASFHGNNREKDRKKRESVDRETEKNPKERGLKPDPIESFMLF